jgi:4-hydroxyphenylacetate 3-monooxygenase
MITVPVIVRSLSGGDNALDLTVERMVNLGSATRDAETAVAHQDEVAKHGIRIATSVPAPRIYPIGTHALTTGDSVEVHTPETSGEVEIVVIRDQDGRVLVGVGSDHTDRALERTSIPWSKQACPNVLAPVLWPLEEIRDHWDDCVLKSWVDGRLYQDVSVAAFLHPDDVLRIVAERAPGLPQRGLVIFCGTIVSVDKRLGFGRDWRFQLDDPTAGRRIEHGYTVVEMFEAIAEGYRVPVVTGDGKPAAATAAAG